MLIPRQFAITGCPIAHREVVEAVRACQRAPVCHLERAIQGELPGHRGLMELLAERVVRGGSHVVFQGAVESATSPLASSAVKSSSTSSAARSTVTSYSELTASAIACVVRRPSLRCQMNEPTSLSV